MRGKVKRLSAVADEREGVHGGGHLATVSSWCRGGQIIVLVVGHLRRLDHCDAVLLVGGIGWQTLQRLITRDVFDEAWLVRRMLLRVETSTTPSALLLALDVIGEAAQRGHLVRKESKALTVLVSLRLHLLTAVHRVLESLCQLVVLSLQTLIRG